MNIEPQIQALNLDLEHDFQTPIFRFKLQHQISTSNSHFQTCNFRVTNLLIYLSCEKTTIIRFSNSNSEVECQA